MLRASALFVLAGTLASSLWSASFCKVRIDESQTSNAARFAPPGKTLCEEWYPRINEALFGPKTRLPFKTVVVVFKREIHFGEGEKRIVIPAYANGNTIYINSEYVVQVAPSMPTDFAGMFIHELTHVDQHYPNAGNAGWLVEGIADYVRHRYFEKDIESRLHLDANGHLQGFEADRNKGDFDTQGYLAGYTATGSFLYWLEVRKDKDIVPALNKALREHQYSDQVFDRCGVPLGALWHEFVEQSKQGS